MIKSKTQDEVSAKGRAASEKKTAPGFVEIYRSINKTQHSYAFEPAKDFCDRKRLKSGLI